MSNCIFCKIIDGEISSEKIYEDERVYAFLDISPKSKGHTLIIPKKHFENIYDVEEEYLCEILKVTKKLSIRVREKLNPDGIKICQNNGEAAGQTVFHIHFHIIPKYENEQEYDIDEVYDILKD
jgi:histidine triad (HIT) family protein